MAGQINISGQATGEAAGVRTFQNLAITGSAVVNETWSGGLASGDNTIPVPLGSVAAMIIPPATGTVTLKLRTNTNSGDAGLVLNATNLPVVYPFPATAPTSLIINASGAQPALLTIVFI